MWLYLLLVLYQWLYALHKHFLTKLSGIVSVYDIDDVIEKQSETLPSLILSSLGARPSKNRKGGSGTSAGVEVYTVEC